MKLLTPEDLTGSGPVYYKAASLLLGTGLTKHLLDLGWSMDHIDRARLLSEGLTTTAESLLLGMGAPDRQVYRLLLNRHLRLEVFSKLKAIGWDLDRIHRAKNSSFFNRSERFDHQPKPLYAKQF
jgi:hypothetical protein